MKDLGVMVPLVTPCLKTGRPDLGGTKRLCRRMIDAGCDAVFVAGSTGRGPWFSRADIARLCKAAADQMNSNTLLCAGCMASGLPDMLENTRALADAGADVAVLAAPGYFTYSQKEVEAIFLKFADLSPLPVMIYDIPDFAGMKLEVRLMETLARHDNVIGFKDSSSDIASFKRLLTVCGEHTNFYLLQGKEHLLAESIQSGASGMTVSLVHVNPHVFVALYHACRSGDLSLASQLQSCITEVMNIVIACFKRRRESSTLFHFLNCVLKEQGYCENILLEHEGLCPHWIANAAQKAMHVFESVRTPTSTALHKYLVPQRRSIAPGNKILGQT